MIDVFSDVIQFRGTHYEFGLMQGRRLIDSPVLENRNKHVFSKRKHGYVINEAAYKEVIHKFAPKIWDEINGIADGLGITVTSAIEQFGGYYLEFQHSGCTVFSGQDYLVRNYDFHPNSYDGRIIAFHPSDGGYATLGPSMQITGRTDGINEKGLIMGYNFVNRRGSVDGFLCNMIGRIILETCASVDEAIDLLKEIPHRNTFNYILLDKKNTTYVVEASPTDVNARKETICTNHFDILTAKNRHHLNNSLARQRTMKAKEPKINDALAGYRMMNDLEEDIYGTDYVNSNGTLHTSIYFPNTGKAGISLRSNRLPFMFDFKKWLQGEPFNVKQIKGELDADHPFANEILA